MSTQVQLPILYSFRRCPYAMRTRMALYYAKIDCEIREIDLKNKPASLIDISPKATVPVLILPNNEIIEESLDIVYFALLGGSNSSQNSSWLAPEKKEQIELLISNNDQKFALLLRKYKYFENYPEDTQLSYRQDIEKYYLQKYEIMLQGQSFLLGRESIADLAILPFIRQLALVDADWFFTSQYQNIITWLNSYLEQDHFQNIIMAKYKIWQPNQPKQYFLS